jgi:hypothetical protein
MTHREAEPLVEFHDADAAEEGGLASPRLGQALICADRALAGGQTEEKAGLSPQLADDARRDVAAHLFVVSRHLDAHPLQLRFKALNANVTRVARAFPLDIRQESP